MEKLYIRLISLSWGFLTKVAMIFFTFSLYFSYLTSYALKRPPKRFILMLGKHRPSSTCIIILKKSIVYYMSNICNVYKELIITLCMMWKYNYYYVNAFLHVNDWIIFSHFLHIGRCFNYFFIFFIFFFISLNFLRKTL